MKKLIISLLILVSSTIVNAANECRLKYKNNGSGFQYKNTNKGQSINFVRSNFTDAFNVGRNDMRLTLEYFDVLSQRNKTEYLYLIKSGNITVPLPPIPLVGKKLKKIECKNYGTVVDAQRYLQQLGSSASAVVTNATTQATTAISNAATAAGNSFSAQSANRLKSDSQTAINQLTNAFNQAKREAGNTARNIRTSLKQHFPEVDSAVQATNAYRWQVSDSVLNQGEQNVRRTLGELTNFDRKYKVSQTVANLVQVNMAKDFPEQNALFQHQCRFNSKFANQFVNDLKSIEKQLANLDKKYEFSSNAKKLVQTLIKLPGADMKAVKDFRRINSCQDEFSKLLAQLGADRLKLSNYSKKLLDELKKLDRRIFTKSQRKFVTEIDKLIKATIDLDKEHKAQEKREEAMEKAKVAHRKALDKIENDIGPLGDFLEKLPGGEYVIEPLADFKRKLPAWMTRDPKRLKANLADAKRKGDAYDKAVRSYDNGFDRIQSKYDRWLRQISTTVKTGTRLKVKLPNGSPLMKLLSSPPKLTVTLKAFDKGVQCVGLYLEKAGAAFAVFISAIDQYLSNIDGVLESALPDDVRVALKDLDQSVKKLKSKGLNKITKPKASASLSALSKTVSDFGKLFNGDLSAANFEASVNRAFTRVNSSVSNAKKDINTYKGEIDDLGKQVNNVRVKAAKLEAVLKKHAKSKEMTDLTRAMNKLYSTSWNAVGSVVKDSLTCVDEVTSKVALASKRFGTRLAAFLKSKVQTTVAGIPKNLKAKIANTIASLNQLLGSYSQFKSAALEAKSAYNRFDTSRSQLIGALVPVPQANAQQKLQDTSNKLSSFTQKLNTAKSKFASVVNKQNTLVREIDSLVSELNRQGAEIRRDASKIVYAAIDTQLMARQEAGLANLANKWTVAANKFPERLASLATRGMSDQVKTQIEQGIAEMNRKFSSLNQCVSTASNKRSSIMSQQQRAQALNQTIAGLNADAVAVLQSLNSLLSPNPGILNRISNSMNKAGQLLSRVQSIGNTARTNFNQNISNLKRDLTTAKQCVTGNKTQILSKKNQMMRLLE